MSCAVSAMYDSYTPSLLNIGQSKYHGKILSVTLKWHMPLYKLSMCGYNFIRSSSVLNNLHVVLYKNGFGI